MYKFTQETLARRSSFDRFSAPYFIYFFLFIFFYLSGILLSILFSIGYRHYISLRIS